MRSGVDWSALIGGLIGAGIPTLAAAVGMRRQRQTADAEAFGPAVSLLRRVNPDRVLINANPDAEAQYAEMRELEELIGVAGERLLVVAAGNPRRRVRKLAREAEVKLGNVFHGTAWAVRDLLQNRDNPAWMDHARNTFTEADRALTELIEANFAWFSGWPRAMLGAAGRMVRRALPGRREKAEGPPMIRS
jgi:hypothetical protein